MSDSRVENAAYRWARRGLIVIGALGVIGALWLVLLITTGGWDGPRPEPARVKAAEPGRGFTVGDATAVPGTPYVRISILEGGSRDGGSYRSSRDDLRNLLILHVDSGQSWRLLPDNNRRIETTAWYPAAATGPADDAIDSLEAPAPTARGTSAPMAFYTLLVAGSRGYDLIAGRLDDRRNAVVLTGIDGIDGNWMRSPEELALVVRQNGKLSYRVINMNTLKVIGERGIAIE